MKTLRCGNIGSLAVKIFAYQVSERPIARIPIILKRLAGKFLSNSAPGWMALVAAAFLGAISPVHAQLPYTLSWVGNSWEGGTNHAPMQNQIEGIYVNPNSSSGIVYTDGFYNEQWTPTGIYQSGTSAGTVQGWGGWGRSGGCAVGSDGTYLYIAMVQSGGYGSGTNAYGGICYPATSGSVWFCVRRYNLTGTPQGFSTGNGYDGSMLVVNSGSLSGPADATNTVSGIACSGSQLFVSDPRAGQVKVYNLPLSGSAPALSINVSYPGTITMESSGTAFWVIQNGDSVYRYSTKGILDTTRCITGSTGFNPTSIAISNTGNLLLADNGPDQQVKFYNIAATGTLSPTSTLGTRYGSATGGTGDLVFAGLAGVGCDSTGKIYVGCNEFDDCSSMCLGGAVMKAFASKTATSASWKLYGLMFTKESDFDVTSDGCDIVDSVHHYKMDYTQGPGQEWSYYAFSGSPFVSPQDIRFNTGSTISTMLRYVYGEKFTYDAPMGEGALSIHRFSGEMAIPSAILAVAPISGLTPDWPPNMPTAGAWKWRDSNGSGDFDASDYYDATGVNDPASWSWWVDHNGDVWEAYEGGSKGIKRYPLQGLDSYGNPIYSNSTAVLYAVPSPDFTGSGGSIERINYVSETDTMYIGGYTNTYPCIDTSGTCAGPWGDAGRVLNRYDGWVKSGTSATCHTKTYQIVLPWVTSGTAPHHFIKAFSVAGEKLFCGDNGNTAQIYVYNALNGSYQQTLLPGGSTTEIDSVNAVNAFQRKANGEYLVLVEDDGDNNNLLYELGGTTVATYNAYNPNNVFAGSASYTSYSATWLSGNGSVTINNISAATSGSYQLEADAATGDNQPRYISISVNGAAPITLRCPQTGADTKFLPLWTTIPLNSGTTNTIKFYGNGALAADIGQFRIMASSGTTWLSANFQDGNNPFTGGSTTGGSCTLLQNVPTPGSNAIQFTDGSTTGSNAGSAFTWVLSSTNALVQRINQVLTGTTPATFTFDFQAIRTGTSNSPVYANIQGYLEAVPNDGNPPTNGQGRDRFWTTQAGFGTLPGYQSGGLITVDDTVYPEGYVSGQSWRGYRFTVTPNGTGETLTSLNVTFTCRVNGNATPESYAVTNIHVTEVP